MTQAMRKVQLMLCSNQQCTRGTRSNALALFLLGDAAKLRLQDTLLQL